MTLAPIALFVYDRPHHTAKCLDALSQNELAKDSKLIIFSDGPKTGADLADLKMIDAVRRIIESENRFKHVQIVKRETNKGLADSIINGVSEVLSSHDSVIVLEDDLITSPDFLSFMNQSLQMYKSREAVCCITGYIYPTKRELPKLFFLKGADCWGWATWRRGWKLFEKDGGKLLSQIENQKLQSDFDFFDSYPYTQMLCDQIKGKNNSWAIRWYASAFLLDKLTLYPGKSLVKNIGFDGSGTHSGMQQRNNPDFVQGSLSVEVIDISENRNAKEIIAEYFREQKERTFRKVLKSKFDIVLKKFFG